MKITNLTLNGRMAIEDNSVEALIIEEGKKVKTYILAFEYEVEEAKIIDDTQEKETPEKKEEKKPAPKEEVKEENKVEPEPEKPKRKSRAKKKGEPKEPEAGIEAVLVEDWGTLETGKDYKFQGDPDIFEVEEGDPEFWMVEIQSVEKVGEKYVANITFKEMGDSENATVEIESSDTHKFYSLDLKL